MHDADRTFAVHLGQGCWRWPQCLVIAEAGVNHNGDVQRAHALIEAAARAGADAVKFQHFRAADLVAPQAPSATYQRHAGAPLSQRDLLEPLELPLAALKELASHAHEAGLVFLATPFGTQALEELLRVPVEAVKIASTDLVNGPLLEAASRTGLPLIVSTGTAEQDEIDAAVGRIERCGAGDRLVLLHCVSAYPTPLERANLRAIISLRERYGVPAGFSDHTTSAVVGAWAVACGAVVLEKHLTLDRSLPGPDHAFSLTPEDFAEYAAQVRAAGAALGDGSLGCQPEELEVRRVARGRLIAARSAPAGAVLEPSMVRIQRAGQGLEAGDLDALLGRRLARPLRAGQPLTREHFDPPVPGADGAAGGRSASHAPSGGVGR